MHATLLRDALNNARVVYVSRNWSAGLFLYDPAQGVNSPHYRLPAHGHETFCSGHAVLSDGRLFVAGGNGPSYWTGEQNSVIFDISQAAQCAYTGWTQKAPMTYGRWYPTVTMLADGRALVTSGNRFANMVVFGGRVSGTASSDLRVVGQDVPMVNASPSPSGTAPAAREGHCSVFTGTGGEWERRTLILGGKDATGALLPMTVHALTRDDRLVANPYGWTTITTSGGPPPSRTNAAATFNPSGAGSLYIHGGLDANGQPLSDLWRLTFAFAGATTGTWTQLATSPLALHGHTLNHDGSFTRLLVFGGTDGSTTYDRVYSYSLSSGTWTLATTGGTPPSARLEHAAAIAPGGSVTTDDVMYVHGGKQGSTYYDDLYSLNLSSLIWSPFSPAPTSLAPARASHQMVLDEHDYNRLLILGGENASGALSDAWSFSFSPYIWPPSSYRNWVETPVSPTLATRSEHTMVYDPRGTFATVPEIYDPAANNWSQLTNADRWLPMYPRMFALPNGELFYAGPDHDTRKLNLSSGWAGSTLVSNDLGYSAVQYAPGKIMKCGGHLGRTEIISFDASGNTSGWQYNSAGDLPGMSTRAHINLTLLPTGQALLTNGTADHNFNSTPKKIPYLWTPPSGAGTGSWSAALAEEPESRGYHSTALLLPDGRIFSAGGFVGPNPALNTARIYSPPYLFDPVTNDPAPRPIIAGAPANVAYQSVQGTFDVCMATSATAVQKVCLIRPGSVTHGFNTDQRYVPLSFTADPSCSHLRVTGPANANEAPPGDYMLFVVNSAGVPSEAKWVRVSSQAGTNANCADVCPPVTAVLNAVSKCTSIQLSWTAPGDDGVYGSAFLYDLRRSTSPMTTDALFLAAPGIAVPSPQPPGSSEQHIEDLGSCSPQYYYRLRTRDDAGNWSAISNQVTGKTACLQWPRQCMDEESAPVALELSAHAPSPRGTGISVSYSVPDHCEGEPLDLSIFDLAGRRVTVLEHGAATPGEHVRSWANRGGAVGVYFARLNCGGKMLTRTLVVTP